MAVFKYITTIVMLIIFPLSVIGVNVSVHKCKHKGSIYISFFDSFDELFPSDCCCSESAEEDTDSCCNTDDHDACAEKHVNTKESGNEEIGVCACCNDENSNEKNNNIQPLKNAINHETNSNLINELCCSNSGLSYCINSISFINLDKSKLLKLSSIFRNQSFTCIFNLINVSSETLKSVSYPLKEPILQIISFIHSASISVDDSEDPFI